MNEQAQAPLSEQDRKALQESLQQGRESFKAEVARHNEADAERLGSIAAGHEVHVAPNGVVLTEKEHQDILARRQAA